MMFLKKASFLSFVDFSMPFRLGEGDRKENLKFNENNKFTAIDLKSYCIMLINSMLDFSEVLLG